MPELLDILKPNISRWLYPHSPRTFAYTEKNISNIYYYNVNFSCNSDCVFCASDLTRNSTFGKMPIDSILQSFKNNFSQNGNAIVINGGEATLYKELFELTSAAVSYGAQAVLFTNGRKFSDLDYAKHILQNITRVTIPLYGDTSKLHDQMTAKAGSFNETAQGITNILLLKESLFPNLLLELKCLTVGPCLERIPKIIDFIHSEFGLPDRFVLSGVIPSKKVLAKKSELLPNWHRLSTSARESFDSLMGNGYQIVSLPDFPLCLLEKEHLDYYLMQNLTEYGKLPLVKFLYFDAFHTEGVRPETKFEKPDACLACPLSFICDADNNFLAQIDPGFCNLNKGLFQIQGYFNMVGGDSEC